VCSKGTCVATACPTGTTACPSHVGFGGADNSCVNTDTDYFNCGACGNICGLNRVCVAGTCRDYQPALGCATCGACSFCAGLGGGTHTCCPGMTGMKEAICVGGAVCP
jgi:hypothetical protein